LSKEAKIGLLLGLVFIVAIAVVLRGVHRDSLTIMDESVGISKTLPEVSETVPLSSVVDQLSSEHRPAAEHRAAAPVNAEPQASARPGASVTAPGAISVAPGASALDNGQVRFVGELPSTGSLALAITQAGLTSEEQLSSPGPIIMPPSGAIERAVANLSQQRAAATPAVEQSRKYVVGKGDDLSSIAIKCYGQAAGNKRANIERIFNANRETMHSINEVQVGQQLVIPLLEREASGSSSSSKIPDTKSSSQPTVHKEKYYVVQEGDSLWSIAAQKLGDGKRFSEIAKLNSKILGDKNNVYPGMRLQIP
jgi:nucleoid-associated protein YgaU